MTYLDEFKYVVQVATNVKLNDSNNDAKLLKQVLQHRHSINNSKLLQYECNAGAALKTLQYYNSGCNTSATLTTLNTLKRITTANF